MVVSTGLLCARLGTNREVVVHLPLERDNSGTRSTNAGLGSWPSRQLEKTILVVRFQVCVAIPATHPPRCGRPLEESVRMSHGESAIPIAKGRITHHTKRSELTDSGRCGIHRTLGAGPALEDSRNQTSPWRESDMTVPV